MHYHNLKRSSAVNFILAFGTFGFLCGMVLARMCCSNDCTDLIRSAAVYRPSVSGVLFLTVLPFFFVMLAIVYSKPWILAFILYCKMFSFGFVAQMILTSFETAGWILQFLMLFTDSFIIMGLVWISIRYLTRTAAAITKDIMFCFAGNTLAGVLDYFYISQFLSSLFTNLER